MRLVIDDEQINELEVNTIRRLIDTLRNSHEIDVLVRKRKDGINKYFQADWLKHMRVEDRHGI